VGDAQNKSKRRWQRKWSFTTNAFTSYTVKRLISKEKGGQKPLFYWQQALSIPKSKVLYKTKRLAFHTIVIISRQKKRALRPFLFATFRCHSS
jgi:hypothetical protein